MKPQTLPGSPRKSAVTPTRQTAQDRTGGDVRRSLAGLGYAEQCSRLAPPTAPVQLQEDGQTEPRVCDVGWDEEGRNAGPMGVGPTGRVAGEEGYSAEEAVQRVPLDDLSSVDTHLAIAFVPGPAVLAESRPLDVLVHCHGGGAQSEPRDNRSEGEDDPDAKRYNDLNVGQIPQQIAASNVAMVGIVAQLSHYSGEDFDMDAMVTEVFERLRCLELIADDQLPGRVVISAHSRGSRTALDEAEAHFGAGDEEGTGAEGGLFLFDPYLYDTGRDERRRLRPQDPEHEQWVRLREFLQRRFDEDLAALEGLPPEEHLEYVRTQGFVFRGYTRDGSRVYGDAMEMIRTAIQGWIAAITLPLAEDVLETLARNYEVELQRPGGGGDRHSASVTAPDARNQVDRREDRTGNGRWVRDYEPGTGNLEDAVRDYSNREDRE